MSLNRHNHARQNEETDWNPPALWNPNAAAAWSLLFTPVFGAVLHMRNARTMGDKRLRKLNKWFLIGFVLSMPLAEIAIICYSLLFDRNAVFFILLMFLIVFFVWYIAAGCRQADLLKEQYGPNYPRKPWFKVLLLGVLGNIVVHTVVYGLAFGLFVVITIVTLLIRYA